MRNLNLEKEIRSYLREHGNTKEADLVNFGTYFLHTSRREIESVLEKMLFEGKISRVVHSKLGPNAVYYITREGCCLQELAVEIGNDALDLRDNGNFSESAGRILNEAAALAEKRIKERYPEYQIG